MNKKLITALVAVAAVLALSFCLAACGDDGTQPGGGESGNTAHKISVDAPDDVEVTTSAASASAGTTITVNVVVPSWKIVTFVTAADVNIVKDEAASVGSTSVYTFTMPDRDVELNVETMDSGASVDEDDGLKWVAAPKQIALGKYSIDAATYEVDFGGSVIATTDVDGNLSGVKISSTDQDVIPDEAIAGAYRIGDSAYTRGATFTVDLTKVSIGSTTLIFEDARSDRTITKFVQVVKYGTVVPGEVVNTTLKVKYEFDEGDLDLDDGIDPQKLVVVVSVNDIDWVDGTDPDTGAEEYAQQRFRLSNKGSKTFAIGYIKGHRYRVSVTLYSYTNDYETDGYPEFSQVYGNELMLYDHFAGLGNSVSKDKDGVSWLKIDNASSTVELTVNVKK